MFDHGLNPRNTAQHVLAARCELHVPHSLGRFASSVTHSCCARVTVNGNPAYFPVSAARCGHWREYGALRIARRCFSNVHAVFSDACVTKANCTTDYEGCQGAAAVLTHSFSL